MINREFSGFDQAETNLAPNTYYQTPTKKKHSLSKMLITSVLTILIFIIPWIFCINTEEYYEITKNSLLLIGIGLLVMIWSVTTIINKRVTIYKTPIDLAILIMLVISILATVFSVNTDTSIWGYHVRITGGLISYILLAAVYYLVINNINDKATIKSLLRCIVYSISLVALFTILKSLGLLAFVLKPLADSNPSLSFVTSALFTPTGNPNVLSYLFLTGLPLSVFLFINKKGSDFKNSFTGMLTAILLILAFAFTSITDTTDVVRIVSWLLAIGTVVTGIIFAANNSQRKSANKLGLNISLLFVITLGLFFSFDSNFRSGVNNALSGAGLEYNFSRYYDIPISTGYQVVSGTYNKYSIKSILIGTGLDTYAYMFPQFRPAEQNLQANWFESYTRSNTEIESLFVGTGILGTILLYGSLLFFIGKFLIKKIFKHKEASQHRSLLAVSLVMILFLCSFFLVYHSITLLFFFWVIMALGFKLYMINYPEETDKFEAQFKLINKTNTEKSISIAPYVFATIIITAVVILFVQVTTNYYAESYYSQGEAYTDNNEYDKAYDNYFAATKLNPYRDYYQRQIATVALSKLESIVKSSSATTLTDQEKTDKETIANYLLNLITTKVDQTLLLNAENYENWQRAAVIYKRLTELSNGSQFGSEALKAVAEAIQYNPTNPDNYLMLGYIYQYNSDTTLKADAEKAYYQAWSLQPSYALSIVQLGGYYEYTGNYDKALELYQNSLNEFYSTKSAINTFLTQRITAVQKQLNNSDKKTTDSNTEDTTKTDKEDTKINLTVTPTPKENL